MSYTKQYYPIGQYNFDAIDLYPYIIFYRKVSSTLIDDTINPTFKSFISQTILRDTTLHHPLL